MIGVIRCISNKGKTPKKEWESDDSDLLWALSNIYKKIDNSFSILTC